MEQTSHQSKYNLYIALKLWKWKSSHSYVVNLSRKTAEREQFWINAATLSVYYIQGIPGSGCARQGYQNHNPVAWEGKSVRISSSTIPFESLRALSLSKKQVIIRFCCMIHVYIEESIQTHPLILAESDLYKAIYWSSTTHACSGLVWSDKDWRGWYSAESTLILQCVKCQES